MFSLFAPYPYHLFGNFANERDSGTDRHHVKLYNLVTGTHLSSFEPYSSFLHQNRSAAIATTAFHPHRMMIAGASQHDTHVNIFAVQDGKKDGVVETY